MGIWGWRSRRDIFNTRVGGRTLRLDPLATWRRLLADERGFVDRVKLHQHGDAEATDALVAIVREVFALEPFGSGGPTDLEALDLLGEFVMYLETLKKKRGSLPTAWQPTGSTGSADPRPTTSASA